MRTTVETKPMYALIQGKKDLIALHKNAIEALNNEIAIIKKEIAYIHKENARIDPNYVRDINCNHKHKNKGRIK